MYTKMNPLLQVVELNNLKSEAEQIAWVKMKKVSLEILNHAFLTAVINGFLPLVKALSKISGVDPTADNNDAIQAGAQYGQEEVVKYLCTELKLDPAANNSSAICLAAQNGHLNVIKFLCTFPQVDPTADKDSAILAALEFKKQEVVNFLASLPCYNPFNPNIGLERKNELINLLTRHNLQKQLNSHQIQANLHLGFLFFNKDYDLDCLTEETRRNILEIGLELDYHATAYMR